MYRIFFLLLLYFGTASSAIVLAEEVKHNASQELTKSSKGKNNKAKKKEEPLDWKVKLGITVVAGGLIGYMGYWWWRRREQKKMRQNLVRSATVKFVQADHLPRKNDFNIPRNAKLHFTNEGYIVPIQLAEGSRFILGADPEIIVEDGQFIDDPFLSNNHAEIVCLNGIFYIQDNNSTNGTFVNGLDIRNSNMIELKQGTIINLGNTYIEFSY